MLLPREPLWDGVSISSWDLAPNFHFNIFYKCNSHESMVLSVLVTTVSAAPSAVPVTPKVLSKYLLSE